MFSLSQPIADDYKPSSWNNLVRLPANMQMERGSIFENKLEIL